MMKKFAIPLLLMALLASAVYAGTLDYPFVFDDYPVVIENPTIRYPSSIPKFFYNLQNGGETDNTQLFRPIVFSSYALNYMASGLKPFSYHLVDLILHIFNTFLLFLIITELQKIKHRENRTIALLFSALFCLHPVLTQSVIYISARSVLLMTFFCLGSLLAYIKYRTTGKTSLYMISIAILGCALLTKESSLPFIGVIFLLELFFKKEYGDNLKPALVKVTPFGAACAFFVGFRYLVISREGHSLITGNYLSHWLAEISVVPRYILLILNPFRICVNHYVPDVQLTDGNLWAGFVIILAVAGLFFVFLKKDILTACIFAWPFLMLLPEMILPLPERMVEYRLYMPMTGMAVLLSLGALKWTPELSKASLRFSTAIILLFLTISGALAFEAGKVWASPATLWQDAINKYPSSPRPYNNLGQYFALKGEYAKSIQLFTAAIKLDPNHDDYYNNLGAAYAITGNYDAAKKMTETAIKINPKAVKAYINLGNIESATGNNMEAIRMYNKAIGLNHSNLKAYYNLGTTYLETGAYRQAYETFRDMAVNCPEGGKSKIFGAKILYKYGQAELASKLMELP